MGVPLKSFLDPVLEGHYPSEFRKMSIVVDALNKIIEFCIGHRNTGEDIIDSNGECVSELFACYTYAIRLLSSQISPIFVFDGASPESKKKTTQKRKNNCIKATEQLKSIIQKHASDESETPDLDTDEQNTDEQDTDEQYTDEQDTDEQETDEHEIDEQETDRIKSQLISDKEYIKQFKRSYRPRKNIIERCKCLLRAMGIPVVEAVDEADSQCVAIERFYSDKVIGIMTNDFDALLFGASRMLKGYKSHGSHMIDSYSFVDILQYLNNIAKIINPGLELTRDKFVDFCILLGTDYNHSIKGTKLKPNKMFELFVEHDMDVDKLLSFMQQENTVEKKYYIPTNFMESFTNAKEQYVNAKVKDPKNININLSRPNEKMIREIMKDVIDDNSLSISLSTLRNSYEMITNNPKNDFNSAAFGNFNSYKIKRDKKTQNPYIRPRYGNNSEKHKTAPVKTRNECSNSRIHNSHMRSIIQQPLVKCC